MRKGNTVDEYILADEKWQAELLLLRDIIKDSELEECIKWGAPAYTFQGKNIVAMAAFKHYVGIWFHQGVFLKDDHQKLFNAQEGKTKALRQWHFSSLEEIEEDVSILKAYIEEAIENHRQGKEFKINRETKKIEIPIELEEEFAKKPSLRTAFKKLSPGRQREYAEYVSTAKRAATRQIRLDKIIPMIELGKGMNDQYRSK